LLNESPSNHPQADGISQRAVCLKAGVADRIESTHMRHHIFILSLLAILIGCKQSSNPVAPLITQPSSVSSVKDSILYTFAVSQNTLGILDTLTMTLTALNQSTSWETLSVRDPRFFYTWSLTNVGGTTINSGSWSPNPYIPSVVIIPNQSAVLYRLGYSMAEIFRGPIVTGFYLLQWNLDNGLSFQLNLFCGKSENEIIDPSGIISPIYPLRVGNKWTFRTSNLWPDGSVTVSNTVTQTIVAEEMINGEKWFLLASTLGGAQLITARQDGIYFYYSDLETAVLEYKYPAVTGYKYASGYEVRFFAKDTLVTFQMSVGSTNQVVCVPSGQYQCYEYSAPDVNVTFKNGSSEISSEDMFLSNIGPVKRIIYDNNGTPYYSWELISTNVQ
jgi:hypothetical protein